MADGESLERKRRFPIAAGEKEGMREGNECYNRYK